MQGIQILLIPAFWTPPQIRVKILFNSPLRLVWHRPAPTSGGLAFSVVPNRFNYSASFQIHNLPPEPTSPGGHFAPTKLLAEGEDKLAPAAELIRAAKLERPGPLPGLDLAMIN